MISSYFPLDGTMKDDGPPLPINEFKVKMVGYRQQDMKYRGFLFCSMTGSAADPSCVEYQCHEMSNTPDQALKAATALLQKLIMDNGSTT